MAEEKSRAKLRVVALRRSEALDEEASRISQSGEDMTENKHGESTAGAGDDLHEEPGDRSEKLDAYLTAVLSPFGGEHEVPSVSRRVDKVHGAAFAKEADVLDDALRAESSDDYLSIRERPEECLIELVRLNRVESKHEVFGNPFDLHGYSSFGDGGRNLITQILTWFMCGAAGATAMLAIEKLTGS